MNVLLLLKVSKKPLRKQQCRSYEFLRTGEHLATWEGSGLLC